MDRASSPRQQLEDFRQFLAQSLQTGSASGEAVIWSNGKEAKASLSSSVKLVEGAGIRNQVREQVKQLLRENHVEITADIKKALPSRFAPGDAARLSQLLGAAAMQLKVHDLASLKPHLQFEIDRLASIAASGKPASLEGFLLDGSGPVHEALLDLLRPAFEDQMNDMAAQAFEKFARGLMFGKSIAEAMDQAFDDLLAQYRALKPGKALVEAERLLSELLDGAQGHAAGAFAAEASKSLSTTLMLAVSAPLLAQALERQQKLFTMAVQDFCTVRGAQPLPEDPGMEPRAKTVIDATELWHLQPFMLAARLAAAMRPLQATPATHSSNPGT